MYDTANKARYIQMGIQYSVDRISNLYHFFTHPKLIVSDNTITSDIYVINEKGS